MAFGVQRIVMGGKCLKTGNLFLNMISFRKGMNQAMGKVNKKLH